MSASKLGFEPRLWSYFFLFESTTAMVYNSHPYMANNDNISCTNNKQQRAHTIYVDITLKTHSAFDLQANYTYSNYPDDPNETIEMRAIDNIATTSLEPGINRHCNLVGFCVLVQSTDSKLCLWFPKWLWSGCSDLQATVSDDNANASVTPAWFIVSKEFAQKPILSIYMQHKFLKYYFYLEKIIFILPQNIKYICE